MFLEESSLDNILFVEVSEELYQEAADMDNFGDIIDFVADLN